MNRLSFFYRINVFTHFLVLFTCGLSAQAGAEPSEPRDNRWTFSFYFENDLFADTDRFYTNGTKFTWMSPDLSEFRDACQLPAKVYQLSQYLPFIHRAGVQRNVAFSFGQNLYTPQDIARSDLIEDERPYAAWLYLSAAFHNKTVNWLDTIEVSIGMVGPAALGEEVQNFVHKRRNIQTAEGWAHQIRNEPGINIIWERKFRYDLLGDGSGLGADVLAHVGGSVGNIFTYANSGGGIRFGWNLPRDFGAALIRAAGDSNAPAAADDIRFRRGAISFHTFAAIDGRRVLRDITLDGNTFRDSHSIDREDWVGDFSLGAALIVGAWKISYAHTARSRTFKGGDRQIFGSINVSLTY